MIEKQTYPKKLKIPKKLKALVIDSVRRHAWNIGVSHYLGDILYMEKDLKKGNDYVLADCTPDRRYLRATFRIYPHFLEHYKSEGAKFVEQTIAHEVAHIATAHFHDCAIAIYIEEEEMKDAWETLTETVGRLSVKLDEALHV